MTNTRKSKLLVDDKGQTAYKWQIRIRSEEPTVIDFKEMHYDMKAPMEECGKLVWRTSYMPGQPNREVWWAVDLWDPSKQEYTCVIDGKSRLRDSAGPL